MHHRTIVELASTITDHTARIDAYLKSQNIPSPSFDPSTSPRFSLPPHLALSQNAILEATDELRAHVLGPVAYLTYQRVSLPEAFDAVR